MEKSDKKVITFRKNFLFLWEILLLTFVSLCTHDFYKSKPIFSKKTLSPNYLHLWSICMYVYLITISKLGIQIVIQYQGETDGHKRTGAKNMKGMTYILVLVLSIYLTYPAFPERISSQIHYPIKPYSMRTV